MWWTRITRRSKPTNNPQENKHFPSPSIRHVNGRKDGIYIRNPGATEGGPGFLIEPVVPPASHNSSAEFRLTFTAILVDDFSFHINMIPVCG